MTDEGSESSEESVAVTCELKKAVESIFDGLKFAEVEIIVRLPAESMPDGKPYKWGYRQLLTPEMVRIQNPAEHIPKEITRIMRMLVMSLRFR